MRSALTTDADRAASKVEDVLVRSTFLQGVYSWGVVPSFVLLSLVLLLGSAFVGEWALVIGMACPIPMIVVMVWVAASFTRVRAGMDGILLEWRSQSAFFTYRDIVECEVFGDVVVITSKNGKVIRLKTGPVGVHSVNAVASSLFARVHAGMDAAVGQEDAIVDKRLARAGRALEAWTMDLAEVGRDDAYRDAALDKERLMGVIASPSSLPSARVGAAAVLRRVGLTADERAHIRNHATTILAPYVSEALEKLIDEAASEQDLEEVMRPVSPRAFI